jgi:hypothetical protein
MAPGYHGRYLQVDPRPGHPGCVALEERGRAGASPMDCAGSVCLVHDRLRAHLRGGRWRFRRAAGVRVTLCLGADVRV